MRFTRLFLFYLPALLVEVWAAGEKRRGGGRNIQNEIAISTEVSVRVLGLAVAVAVVVLCRRTVEGANANRARFARCGRGGIFKWGALFSNQEGGFFFSSKGRLGT